MQDKDATQPSLPHQEPHVETRTEEFTELPDAAAAKAELGLGVRDARREAALLAARRHDAEAMGLDPESVAEIFETVLRVSRRVQGG